MKRINRSPSTIMKLITGNPIALACTVCAIATLGDNRQLYAAQFTRITNNAATTFLSASYSLNWADLNRDGLPDLIVGNCHTTLNVYRNLGGGAFEQDTSSHLATVPNDSSSILLGDLFNSGKLDIYSVNLQHPLADTLIRCNLDETYETLPYLVESASGVGGAFLDYNRDGKLDVITINESGGPSALLYRNDGTNLTRIITTGLFTNRFAVIPEAQSIAVADYNNDGWPDLAITGKGIPGVQYYTNSNGRFAAAPQVSQSTSTGGVKMGIAAMDYDNDGFIDLAVAHYPGPTGLYRNLQGTNRFQQATLPGIGIESVSHTAIAWADVDNNGWPDLFVSGVWGTRNRLYYNNRGVFTIATNESNTVIGGKGNTMSFSLADINGDGFLDLYSATSSPNPYGAELQPNELYLNNGSTNRHGTTNGWVMFSLKGGASNRSAIGARVVISAHINGEVVTQHREVNQSAGWTSPNDMRLHFGLGDASTIQFAEIRWPSGVRQVLSLPVEMRQVHEIAEPAMLVQSDAMAGRFVLVGDPTKIYTVEATEDFAIWSAIGSASGGSIFADSNAANHGVRYYRASDATVAKR